MELASSRRNRCCYGLALGLADPLSYNTLVTLFGLWQAMCNVVISGMLTS